MIGRTATKQPRGFAMTGGVFRRAFILAASALLLIAPPACAHDLRLVSKIDGDQLRIEAFFDDNSPARDATVRVVDMEGRIIAEGKVDERGICNLPVPPQGHYTARVTCLGHSASRSINVFTGEPPPEPEPTRAELTRTPWLRVGIGLGVIAALCVIFLLARRGRPIQPGDLP